MLAKADNLNLPQLCVSNSLLNIDTQTQTQTLITILITYVFTHFVKISS